MRNRTKQGFLAALLIATLIFAAQAANAATYTWIQGPDPANWEDPLNWQGGIVPPKDEAGADLVFSAATTGKIGSSPNTAKVTFGSLTTNSSFEWRDFGTYTQNRIFVDTGSDADATATLANGTTLNAYYGSWYLQSNLVVSGGGKLIVRAYNNSGVNGPGGFIIESGEVQFDKTHGSHNYIYTGGVTIGSAGLADVNSSNGALGTGLLTINEGGQAQLLGGNLNNNVLFNITSAGTADESGPNFMTGGGTNFAGSFEFDLTSAGTTIGNSWNINKVGSATYDAAFAVTGFDNDGDGLWSTSTNGTLYVYDQATGLLTAASESNGTLTWQGGTGDWGAIGDASGNWNDGTNPDLAPLTMATMVIDGIAGDPSEEVTLSDVGTAMSLVVGETNPATLNIGTGGALALYKGATVHANGTLDVAGKLSAPAFSSEGTVTIAATATNAAGDDFPNLGKADIYGGSVTAATGIAADSLAIETAAVSCVGGSVIGNVDIIGAGGSLNTGSGDFETTNVNLTEGASYTGTGALYAAKLTVADSSLSTVGGEIDAAVTVTGATAPGSAELGGVTVPTISVDANSTVTAATPMTVSNSITMGDSGTAIRVTGGSFGAAGTFSANDDDARTLTLNTEGSTVSIGTPGGGTPGIGYIPVTGDADCEIDTAKTYTHAIDFGKNAAATVNGLAFARNFGTASGSITNLGSMTVPTEHAGDNNSNVTGTADGLFRDMRYNDPTTDIVVEGLTAGEWYDFRLYHRSWGDANRSQDFEYYIGDISAGETPLLSVNVNPDRANTDPVNLDVYNRAFIQSYVYQADADGKLSIKINQTGDGTYHLYGLTNELAVVGAASTADMINTDIVVTANSTLELFGTDPVTLGDLSVADSVTGTITGGGGVTFANITGSGTVVTPTIAAANSIAPGASIGTLSVTGDVTIDAAAKLAIEVQGHEGDIEGTPYDTRAADVLAVDGNLDLTDAGLALDFLPGGDATSRFGGTYTVATYSGTLTGTLDTAALLGNIGDYYLKDVRYDVSQGDGTSGIEVELWNLGTGDINLDGYVDVGDLSALSSGWDPGGNNQNSWLTGDLDFSGFVDIGDLSELSAGWAPGGVVLTSGGLDTTAIPEPGSAMMLLLAATGLLAYRRRR